MANLFQIGPDVKKTPYTGCDSNAVIYAGELKTVTQGSAGDVVELVLCEIPAGAKLETVRWAISATLGASSTGILVMRKKNSNAINVGTLIGTRPSAPDISPVPLNGQTITTTAATSGSATLIPTNVEGLSKETLQEPYLLSLQLTTSAAAIPADVKVFVAAIGQFIGTF